MPTHLLPAQFNWMGYSIRAESHRYTIFVEWDGAQLRPQWEAIQSEELYRPIIYFARSQCTDWLVTWRLTY